MRSMKLLKSFPMTPRYQHGHGQVGLFPILLVCERQRGHIEKKDVGEKQTHTRGDEYLSLDGMAGQKFRGSDGSKQDACGESCNDGPEKNQDP